MDSVRVQVLYFGYLRGAAGAGEESVELQAGATFRELIATLVARHGPGFRDSLFWEDGEPFPFVTLLLEGQDIFHGRGLDTPIPAMAEARIVVMPAAMGGG